MRDRNDERRDGRTPVGTKKRSDKTRTTEETGGLQPFQPLVTSVPYRLPSYPHSILSTFGSETEGNTTGRRLRDKDANRVTLCHAVTAGRISLRVRSWALESCPSVLSPVPSVLIFLGSLPPFASHFVRCLLRLFSFPCHYPSSPLSPRVTPAEPDPEDDGDTRGERGEDGGRGEMETDEVDRGTRKAEDVDNEPRPRLLLTAGRKWAKDTAVVTRGFTGRKLL